MNEQNQPSAEVVPTGTSDADAVRLDQGHIHGEGGYPEAFENPGLPPHTPRLTDIDEAAAKRAERQIAGLFTLSIIGSILFLVGYFTFGVDARNWFPGVGVMSTTHLLLGAGLALGLLGIGLGVLHWSRTLMPGEEIVESRHHLASSDEQRAELADTFVKGVEGSQINRRPLIKYSLGGALGLVSLPILVQVVGSLGPLPKDDLYVSAWSGLPDENGKRTFSAPRLVLDPENRPIKASDVTIGSVFHVQPEGLLDLHDHVLEEKGKSSVIVMRLDPGDFADNDLGRKARDWGHDGIVAYSKICTHVGCPVGLYEQTTHHLLCPCHQSTFDVTQDCKVIFGPAKRPLPQLKITVDDEGYLIAAQPFMEPVGPSFWERD